VENQELESDHEIREAGIEQNQENDRTTYVDLSELINIPDELILDRDARNVTIIDTSKVQGVVIISDEDSDELNFEGRQDQFQSQKYYEKLFPLKSCLHLRQGDKQSSA